MKVLLIALLCALAIGAFARPDETDEIAFAEDEDDGSPKVPAPCSYKAADVIPKDQNDKEGQSQTEDENDDNYVNNQVAKDEDENGDYSFMMGQMNDPFSKDINQSESAPENSQEDGPLAENDASEQQDAKPLWWRRRRRRRHWRRRRRRRRRYGK